MCVTGQCGACVCCSGEEGSGVRWRVGEHTLSTERVSGRVCVSPYPSTLRCCLKKSFAANLMAFSGVTRVRFTAAPGWRTTRGTENTVETMLPRHSVHWNYKWDILFLYWFLTTGLPQLIHLHRCPTQQSADRSRACCSRTPQQCLPAEAWGIKPAISVYWVTREQWLELLYGAVRHEV